MLWEFQKLKYGTYGSSMTPNVSIHKQENYYSSISLTSLIMAVNSPMCDYGRMPFPECSSQHDNCLLGYAFLSAQMDRSSLRAALLSWL